MTRFYLHGDAVEGQSGRFYCRTCDLFVDKAHFELDKAASTDGRHGHFPSMERVHQSFWDWQHIGKAQRDHLGTRPRNAPNLLEDLHVDGPFRGRVPRPSGR